MFVIRGQRKYDLAIKEKREKKGKEKQTDRTASDEERRHIFLVCVGLSVPPEKSKLTQRSCIFTYSRNGKHLPMIFILNGPFFLSHVCLFTLFLAAENRHAGK